jgi:hypothetical protein
LRQTIAAARHVQRGLYSRLGAFISERPALVGRRPAPVCRPDDGRSAQNPYSSPVFAMPGDKVLLVIAKIRDDY